MSDNAVLGALRRMGYSKDEMTGHGFRSMASTRLNEMGYNRDHIERQLAHSEGNSVRAAYNYADYLEQRKTMMQEWADYLDELKANWFRYPEKVCYIYVYLVHLITDTDNWEFLQNRFAEFRKNPKIICSSLPVISNTKESDKAELIKKWWREIELQSIEQALYYNHVIHTDITDCYGAIYTHSISWAIHTKKTAKEKRGPILSAPAFWVNY